MAKKLPQITVRSTGDDRKVILFERHPDHPVPTKKIAPMKTGEVLLSNNQKPTTVAETPEVKRLLALGKLERVEEEKKVVVQKDNGGSKSTT